MCMSLLGIVPAHAQRFTPEQLAQSDVYFANCRPQEARTDATFREYYEYRESRQNRRAQPLRGAWRSRESHYNIGIAGMNLAEARDYRATIEGYDFSQVPPDTDCYECLSLKRENAEANASLSLCLLNQHISRLQSERNVGSQERQRTVPGEQRQTSRDTQEVVSGEEQIEPVSRIDELRRRAQSINVVVTQRTGESAACIAAEGETELVVPPSSPEDAYFNTDVTITNTCGRHQLVALRSTDGNPFGSYSEWMFGDTQRHLWRNWSGGPVLPPLPFDPVDEMFISNAVSPGYVYEKRIQQRAESAEDIQIAIAACNYVVATDSGSTLQALFRESVLTGRYGQVACVPFSRVPTDRAIVQLFGLDRSAEPPAGEDPRLSDCINRDGVLPARVAARACAAVGNDRSASDEDREVAHYNLGRARLVARDFDGAIQSARAALAIDENARTYNNLAAAYYNRGDYANASRFYDQSLRLDATQRDIARVRDFAIQLSSQPELVRARALQDEARVIRGRERSAGLVLVDAARPACLVEAAAVEAHRSRADVAILDRVAAGFVTRPVESLRRTVQSLQTGSSPEVAVNISYLLCVMNAVAALDRSVAFAPRARSEKAARPTPSPYMWLTSFNRNGALLAVAILALAVLCVAGVLVTMLVRRGGNRDAVRAAGLVVFSGAAVFLASGSLLLEIIAPLQLSSNGQQSHLAEQRAFDAAIETLSPEDIQRYLTAYPDGEHVDLARTALAVAMTDIAGAWTFTAGQCNLEGVCPFRGEMHVLPAQSGYACTFTTSYYPDYLPAHQSCMIVENADGVFTVTSEIIRATPNYRPDDFLLHRTATGLEGVLRSVGVSYPARFERGLRPNPDQRE